MTNHSDSTLIGPSSAVAVVDKAHFVHPWQLFDDECALPIVRGAGCRIWDADDNEYFDAVGGLWCNNIGLGRREMAEAIAEQTLKLSYANTFVDMTNKPAAILAGKLAELAPGELDHVMFSCGGSTAVDSALRLMQYYNNVLGRSGKKHVISRTHSYHGSTYASMSISGKPGDRSTLFDYMEETIHHVSAPDYYRRLEPDMSEAEFTDGLIAEFENKIIALGGTDAVMAYFAEPVMGAGGVVVPPADYNRRMWEVCRKYDVLYVSDEVVTGFRTPGPLVLLFG